MSRVSEDGACYAYTKRDGTAFVLPRSEHDRLKRDWMAGKAFFEGFGFYGGAITIKLGDIDSSPQSLAAAAQDEARKRQEEAFE